MELFSTAIHRDNEHLHRELKHLKEKSSRQQKVLNKVTEIA